ncbi:MAG: hypothetical protein ACKVUT_12860 [Gaiella sp.]
MPETPEAAYARALLAADAERRLPLPDMSDWGTFPFEPRDLMTRALEPLSDEPQRRGEEGPDSCWRCKEGAERAIWSDEHWLLIAPEAPSGLPVVVLLSPRLHVDFGELPDTLAAELGPLMVRIDRAIRALGHIGRVHIGKWGEGGYHAHLWFIARPAGFGQLRSSFAELWDSVLPPVPEPGWRADLRALARAIAAEGGSAHI